jgi:predicted DNA-binding protein
VSTIRKTYAVAAEHVDRIRKLSTETRVPQAVILREVLDAGLDAWAAMHAERVRPTRRWCVVDPTAEDEQ